MPFPLGKSYSHAGRIVQVIKGVPFISVESISWDVKTNRNFNQGTGKGFFSYGEGADVPIPVTFSMSKTDFMTLQASTISAANPVGNVLRLAPFDILCTDTHPQAPVNTTIKDFYIQGYQEGSALNETDIMVEITGIATAVEFI